MLASRKNWHKTNYYEFFNPFLSHFLGRHKITTTNTKLILIVIHIYLITNSFSQNLSIANSPTPPCPHECIHIIIHWCQLLYICVKETQGRLYNDQLESYLGTEDFNAVQYQGLYIDTCKDTCNNAKPVVRRQLLKWPFLHGYKEPKVLKNLT